MLCLALRERLQLDPSLSFPWELRRKEGAFQSFNNKHLTSGFGPALHRDTRRILRNNSRNSPQKSGSDPRTGRATFPPPQILAFNEMHIFSIRLKASPVWGSAGTPRVLIRSFISLFSFHSFAVLHLRSQSLLEPCVPGRHEQGPHRGWTPSLQNKWECLRSPPITVEIG